MRWMVALLVIAAAGCDLALYDEQTTRAASFAAELTAESTFTVTGWNETGEDDAPLVPTAMYPDSADADSGYLIARDGDVLNVWRVQGSATLGPVDLPSPTQSVHAGWNAWLIPGAVDGAASEPGVVPTLFVTVWGLTEREPRLYAVGVAETAGPADPASPVQREIWKATADARSLGRSVLGGNNVDAAAVQIVAISQGDAIPGGATSGELGAVLQILTVAREAPFVVREVYAVGSAADFSAWAQTGTADGFSTSVGGNSFRLRNRSDGRRPIGIRYGSDHAGRRSILSFRDGDFSSAPVVTLSWSTDGGGVEQLDPGFEPITLSASGRFRDGRTGRVNSLQELSDSPSRSTSDLGSLWYAGDAPPTDRTTGDSPPLNLTGVYSQIGFVRGVPDGSLTISTFRE